MKRTPLVLVTLLISSILFAQVPAVDVADLNVKVGGTKTEKLYYGFAAGDQIVFNFEELKGKPLKELEIIELPSSSKFSDFKTSLVSGKTIKVHKTAVYQFSFKNSAVSSRICKVNIQRIPKSSDLSSFNTNWEWKTLYDTSYVPYTEDSLVGYDTRLVPYTKKELVRVDTTYLEVHSPETEIWMYSRGSMKACLGNSASCTKQKIPLSYPINTEYLLVWVGVGQETRQAFNKLAAGVTKLAIKGGTAYLSAGSSLLANTFTKSAVDSQIDNLPRSKNVLDIHFTDQKWADFWYMDSNNQIKTYPGLSFKDRVNFKQKLVKSQLPGNKIVLCLKNNNINVGTPVSIGVVAVMLDKVYQDKQYTRQDVKPRYVTLNKKKMVVATSQIRVNAK